MKDQKSPKRYSGGGMDKFRHELHTYPIQKNETGMLNVIAKFKAMDPRRLATDLLSVAVITEIKRLKEMGVL